MVVRLGLTLVCAALGAGCLVDVTYPELLACADGVCPEGQTCVNGVCMVGGAVVDASPDADPGISSACGGSLAMSDDFSADATWWLTAAPGAGTVSLVDAATVTLPDAASGVVALLGTPRFNLTASRFFARITPDGSAGVNTAFGIQGPQGSIRIQHQDGALGVGAAGSLATTTYSAADHQFWGFRESGGKLHFETSADGLSWTSRGSIDAPAYAGWFQLFFQVERASSAGVATSTMDDVNGGGPPIIDFCKASELADDFEDGVIDNQRWRASGAGCSNLVEAGGEVIVVVPIDEGCTLAANNLFDLAGSAFVIELGTVIYTPASGSLGMTIRSSDGDTRLELVATAVNIDRCVAGACVSAGVFLYDAAETFWRFRAVGSDLNVETSANGVSYAVRASISGVDLARTSVFLDVAGGAMGQETRVADFN